MQATLRFMDWIRKHLNRAAAASFVICAIAVPALADDDDVTELLERLAQPNLVEWESVEQEIWNEWSKSGSPAMDLLLERGRDAMADGDLDAAIDHLTALTDHAPEFAEGWNARATAYFHAGRYGQSLADIERTLSLNPLHFGAMAGLSSILTEMGMFDEALEIVRRANAIHPHRPDLKAAIERLEIEVGGASL